MIGKVYSACKKKKLFYDTCTIISIMVFCFIYVFLVRGINAIDGDAGNGYYAVLAGNARTFINGELPLWSPYLWGGYTNAGSIFGCFYPIFYLLYFIFWDNNTQTLSYLFLPTVYFINLLVFSCGIYTLNKKITKNRVCSWVCAVLATFCGCTLTGYGWAYIFIGFSWIPFFLYAYMNVLETFNKKWVVVTAAILAMVGFGATSHGLLFLGMSMFFLFISYVICNLKNFLSYLKISFLVGVLGCGLCAIQLLPFIQSMGLSYRYVNTENGILDYAAYVNDVVAASDMHSLLGRHHGWYAMSLLLFLLAINGFKKEEKYKEVQLFAKILFIFSLCMISGAFLPDLMWHIPGINQMREMFLYSPYISISCSILAGISLYNLANMNSLHYKKKVSAANFILGLFYIISLLPENNSNRFELLIKILLFVVFIFYYMPRLNVNWKKYLVCILICLYTVLDFCITVVCSDNMLYMTAREAETKVDIVNTSTRQEFDSLGIQKGERVLTWSPSGTYPTNVASVIGYFDCFAYMNPIYEKNWYLHTMDPLLRSRLQNIKYFFTSLNNDETFLNYFDVYMGCMPGKTLQLYSGYDALEKSGVYVYKNDTLGSAWIVGNYETYKDTDTYEEIFERMSQIELDKKCLINSKNVQNEWIYENNNLDTSVILNSYKANSVQFKCQSDRKSILVTSDILYPGWKVYVDGKKQDILEVNYAFRGVFLEQGEHIVEFKYRPNLVILGAILGFLSIVTCIVLVFGEKSEK